jgi:fumarylacetoacetase
VTGYGTEALPYGTEALPYGTEALPYGTEALPYGTEALPYGVFSRADDPAGDRSLCVRYGDGVVDVGLLAEAGLLPYPRLLAGAATLDPLLAAGRPAWNRVRAALIALLADERRHDDVAAATHGLDRVLLHLPWTVADYVDFYASEQHATNVGRIFRPDDEPLLPNWRRLPVGYHGRAGTVVVSGTDVVRPCGQRLVDGEPEFGPSLRLDVEVEVGFVVGVGSPLGARVSTAAFADHVFGVVLVNDWSARDLQSWENRPLGPFGAKSFATSVGAWVTPLEALAAARVPGPVQDPPVLDYLRCAEPWGLDLALELRWNGELVSRPPFASMYWNAAQQLAHLTVSGASLRTGDLYASGTVSGSHPDERGSLLELTWNGRDPMVLADGVPRTFVGDGDVVTISATAPAADGGRIGLGEVTGRVLPACP